MSCLPACWLPEGTWKRLHLQYCCTELVALRPVHRARCAGTDAGMDSYLRTLAAGLLSAVSCADLVKVVRVETIDVQKI